MFFLARALGVLQMRALALSVVVVLGALGFVEPA